MDIDKAFEILPLVTVVGFLCFVLGLRLVYLDDIRPWISSHTRATILEKGVGPFAKATIRFKDDAGEERIVTVNVDPRPWSLYNTNDSIPVMYRRSRPETAIIEPEPHSIRAAFFLVTGVLLSAPILLIYALST